MLLLLIGGIDEMKHLMSPITAVLTFFGFSQVALADMAIISSSFADGKIAKVHACTKMGGKNQSPRCP